MEGGRLLDVPITEDEHLRHSSDTVRLLTPENTSPNNHIHEDGGSSDISTSLQESVHRVNNPGYSNSPDYGHQRNPLTFDDDQSRIPNLHQSTSYSRETSYASLSYPPDLWKPFWTRKSTLGLLLFIFLLLVIGTVLLWHFSDSLDGSNDVSSVSFYVWRYTPVAFMVVLTGFWRQVDCYFKLLAPWDELRNGPVSASQSLLLDYVSPINIVSLFKAFKRGYTPIILSTTIFFLLKLITIFSAALIVPHTITVESNTTVAVVTKSFDASKVKPMAFPNMAPFSSDPVYSTLGNIAYDLPYPPGVTSQYAYIPIGLQQDTDAYRHNATYTAQTDVFYPNLACTPLQARVIGSTLLSANRTTVNTTNNYLTLQLPEGNICRNWSSLRVHAMNPQTELTPRRQIEGSMQRLYCGGSQGTGRNITEPAGLLFTLTDINYTQVVFPNGSIANSTRNLTAMSNIMCVPNYQILKADVNNNTAIWGADGLNLRISTLEDMMLDGLSGANLAVLYEGIFNASQGIFGTRQDNPQAFIISNTVFNLMGLASNRTNIESFLDPEKMGTAAETTFRRVMAHYAIQTLTRPSLDEFFASSTYTQEKLHVSLVPFCVILAAASMSVLFTSVLWLITPGPLLPRDPSMIATSATILARSPELNRLLRKQMYDNTVLAHTMNGYTFGSAIAVAEAGDTSFKVLVSEATSRSLLPKKKFHHWWSSSGLLIPAFGLAITIPAALIGVLEYLQRHSDRDQGLAAVSNQAYATLGMVCVPVLCLLLVSATIQYLDFHVQLLSPWNKLAAGNAKPKRSLLSHLLGKLPPFALLEAISSGHFGAVFSVLSAIVASAFVILAAGLYYIEDTTQPGLPRQIVATSTFRIQNPYSVFNDNGAAGVLRLVNDEETVYPDGAFDGLVFPTYSRRQTQNTSISLFGVSTKPEVATVPALRPHLRCDVLPQSNIKVTYFPPTRGYNSTHFQVASIYDLPIGCQLGGLYRNASFAYFRNQFNTTRNSTTAYGGQLLDLVFGQNASLVSNYGEPRPAIVGNNPAIGCPSLAFTFAQLLGDTQAFNVTSLVCYQQVEKLAANVTFQRNSTKIDHHKLPVVLDTAMTMVTNPDSRDRVNSFDWRIQRNIEAQLFGPSGTRLRSPTTASSYHFDAFFSYLLNSTSNGDPAGLAGTSNQEHLINVINSLYSKYMAQVINGNMRIPLNQTAAPLTNPKHKRQTSNTNTDTISIETSTTQKRVKQDRTSKLALQILLGISILFTLLAYLFTNFHRLLPANPCTIAGTMLLLAGSDLCYTPSDNLCDCCGKPRRSSWTHEESEHSIHAHPSEYHLQSHGAVPTSTSTSRAQLIPDGAEWFDPRKFAKIFTHMRFSLGWWREDRAKGRRRRFGIDVGERPDGELEDEWEIGRRRDVREQGLESFVMKGRDILGDRRGQYQRADVGEYGGGNDNGHDGGMVFSHGALGSPEPGYGYGYGHEHGYGNGHGHGHGHGHGNSMAHEYELGEPSPPAITSPRRVRFEDEA